MEGPSLPLQSYFMCSYIVFYSQPRQPRHSAVAKVFWCSRNVRGVGGSSAKLPLLRFPQHGSSAKFLLMRLRLHGPKAKSPVLRLLLHVHISSRFRGPVLWEPRHRGLGSGEVQGEPQQQPHGRHREKTPEVAKCIVQMYFAAATNVPVLIVCTPLGPSTALKSGVSKDHPTHGPVVGRPFFEGFANMHTPFAPQPCSQRVCTTPGSGAAFG